MTEIEITGYDVVNGSRQHHKKKTRIVRSIEEVDLFEQEMKRKIEAKRKYQVDIYAVYRQKI